MGVRNDSILEESKKWLGHFYVNGKFVEEPEKFKVGNFIVEDRVMEYLEKLFKFLIDGDMLNYASILWLKSSLPTAKETINFYNDNLLEIDRVNVATAMNNIQYDKKKLNKYFEKDHLINVIYYPDKYLKDANSVLDTLMRKYMKDKEYVSALAIKLNKEYIVKEVSAEDWDSLKELITTYSRVKMKEIENGNDKYNSNVIGYFNYLISSKKLNDLQKDRLNEIRNILGIVE